MIACIVITRDRVTCTRECIASLEHYPELDIHIVDHGSYWGPMLDYLDSSPHPVHRQGDHPPRYLWVSDKLADIVGRHARYLVTDPDIVLDAPDDWLEMLHRELDQGDIVKVGLGLRLDDLPDTELAAKVRLWEAAFWQQRRPSGAAWSAPVDTTLALYPPLAGQPDFRLAPAARLDAPYLVRHIPWYDNNPSLPCEATPSDEAAYYRDRALPGSTHWANGGW